MFPVGSPVQRARVLMPLVTHHPPNKGAVKAEAAQVLPRPKQSHTRVSLKRAESETHRILKMKGKTHSWKRAPLQPVHPQPPE